MPFRSKAQQRWMFAAEARGELPKGTAMEWAHETKKQPGGFKKLPEKVKKPKGFKAKPMKKASEQHIGVTAPDLLPQDTKLTGLEALFPALALGAGGALYGAIQSPGDSPMRGAMIGGAGGVGAGLGFTGGHHFIKSKYGEPMASNAVAAGTILGGAALGGHMGLHTGRALAEMTGVGDPKDKVDNDLEELDVMNGRSHLPGYMGDFVRRKQAFAKVADMFSTTGGGMASPQIAPQPALGLYTDNEPSLPSYAHAVPMGEATPGFKPFQAQPAMMMQGGGFDLNSGFAGQDVTDDQTDDGAGIKLAGYLMQAGRPKHKVSQPSKVTVSKGKSTIQNGSVHPRKAKEPDGKVRRFEADLLNAESVSCEMAGNCKKAEAGFAALFNFPKQANGMGYQHPALQMPMSTPDQPLSALQPEHMKLPPGFENHPLEAGFWSDKQPQAGPPSALAPENESILPAPSPELHSTPTPLPAAPQAPSWLSQHGLSTGAGAAAGLGAYGLMNHLFGGTTEDEEGRHKNPMSLPHAALATGAGAMGGAALSGGLGNALASVPSLSFSTH